MSAFLKDYSYKWFESVANHHRDNYNAGRFGPQPFLTSLRPSLSSIRSHLLAKAGLVRAKNVRHCIDFVQPLLKDLDWLYARLSDQESRELLISIVAFRALGHLKVKLPFNRDSHSAGVRQMQEIARGMESLDANFLGWKLRKMDLRPHNMPVTLFTVPGAAWIQFFEEQYKCRTADRVIEASEGDTGVAAGGCWGDTALYFAVKIGPLGRVFSLEFLPTNLEIFRRNLDLNPHLKDRITLVEHPVWSLSDQELFINGTGPGTRVEATPSNPGVPFVKTISIDDLVARYALSRLDFIKMDIEGAEMDALHGAEAALKRFKPKLAIAVYHKLSDFWSVPQYLDSLGLGYRFHLRHFTMHAEETILFAEAG